MTDSRLSIVRGATDLPMLDLTIGELLRTAKNRTPDRDALVSCHQGVRLSYEELDKASDDFARGLLALGLVRGDRVGVWSPNNVEWIVTMYAVAKVGMILVNVNPAYRPLELEYALNKVGCRALVMANTFKTSNYPDMVRQLAPEVEACSTGVLRASRLPQLEILILVGEQEKSGFLPFTSVTTAGANSDVDLQPFRNDCTVDAPVNIQFTSGTTGSPKGATLSHYNIVNNGFFVGQGIMLSADDRLCAPVPLYHCFGMVMGVLACAGHGATLVLPDESFDPLTTLQAVANEKCTVLYGVPTMFSAILGHDDFHTFDIRTLRTGIVAGSLCPTNLMQGILDDLKMTEVTNCYGMTETSPVSFQTRVDDSMIKRTTTVGQIHPHVRVKIVDAGGSIVPRGQRGEICTKGYSVMQGYWGDEEKTEESIVDGWMLTGDEGVIDDDGYCAIVGRIKDTIIRGGENIAPKEVEEYLIRHVEILEVQAFGIPDDKYGEIVCVWIRKSVDSSLTEQAIRTYCEDQIAHYKIPAIVRFVEEFPMTVTGKVQKFVMRDAMIKELSSLPDKAALL